MTKSPATPESVNRRANPRTCIGCRAVRPRSTLLRCHLDASGKLAIGPGGRGAWLCAERLESCCALAVKRGGFARAFRRPMPAEVVQAFAAEVGIAARRGTDEPLL